VRKLADPGWQSFRGSRVTLGPAALVRLAGTEIDIVLNTTAPRPSSLMLFPISVSIRRRSSCCW
jgi:microcystin degradation protein MlrC